MREVVSKSKMPKLTIIDKALSHIAPTYAMKRYRSRCSMEMMNAYTGASKKRRSMSSWVAASGDFDADVLPELEDLRERSEDLYRNDMLAASGINTKTTCVIGRGLTAQPRIDAKFLGIPDEQADEIEEIAARYWNLWSESKFCTVNKKHNFRELQNIAFLSSLIRGDSFVLTPETNPISYFPFRLRLQLIEADRVCNENNQADTDTLSGGIETFDDGSLKNLHVLKGHPGSKYYSAAEWDKVKFFGEKTGRRNVLHIYKSIRADQSRGVPVLAPVIEGLRQFGTLTQATIDAAVIQTFLSVFIETQDGGGLGLPAGATSETSSESIKLESAAIIDLMPGEVPHVVNPTHPNANYGAFASEFYKQLGAAINVPHEILTKYFQSSYTAAQGALMESWRYFTMRRSNIIDNLCQPVYELHMANMVASGMINAPGFFTDPLIRAAYCGADWVGPPRGHIREDVQNKADGYAEDRGWKTGEQNTQERGGRWERNHRQRVKEVNKRKEDGLITTSEEDNAEDLVQDTEQG